MPAALSRVCTAPGCVTLTKDKTGRCPAHPRQAWSQYTPTKRTRGRKLQALRAGLFQRQPTCEECERQGKTTLATIRDHRIPLAEGGADDATNEQALCEPCHDIKSQAESSRGRTRTRGGLLGF